MAMGVNIRGGDGVRPKKAAGRPVLIQPSGISGLLDKISLDKNGYNEAWLQKLAFDHPQVLPIIDIEPGFGEIYPVAMEVPCAHGYIDNLYVTASGDLVLVEAKLWRNPQARREVVAQALDYVAALMAMLYEAFENACRRGQGMAAAGLYALVADKPDALAERDFIGAVSRNLRRGRMLVIALGDGIRAEAELLAELLQNHAGAHFTFALVELATWENRETGDIIALPGTLAQTVMITRGIVAVEEGVAVVRPVAAGPDAKPTTISEELYFEELARRDPAWPGQVRAFVAMLEPVGVYGDLKASLNLRADLPEAVKPTNFGYITKTGKIWTDTLSATAPMEIAARYNQALANMIGGEVTQASGGQYFVTTNGKSAPLITALLPQHAQAWASAIRQAIDAIRAASSEADA